MTAPETGIRRLLLSFLLGAALGLIYGFLRPLRRRMPLAGEGLFLLCAGWIWLIWGFGVCRGDLRMGGFLGMAAAGILWETTAGKLLRPVFGGFWQAMEEIWGILLLPVKNFPILQKLCLHLRENGLQ